MSKPQIGRHALKALFRNLLYLASLVFCMLAFAGLAEPDDDAIVPIENFYFHFEEDWKPISYDLMSPDYRVAASLPKRWFPINPHPEISIDEFSKRLPDDLGQNQDLTDFNEGRIKWVEVPSRYGDETNHAIEFIHNRKETSAVKPSVLRLVSVPIKVLSETPYLIEGYVRTENYIVGDNYLGIAFFNDDDEQLGFIEKTVPSVERSPTWQHVSSPSFHVPEGTAYARLVLTSIVSTYDSRAFWDDIFLLDYNTDFELDMNNDKFPDNWEHIREAELGFPHFRNNKAYLIPKNPREPTEREKEVGVVSGRRALKFLLKSHNVGVYSKLIPFDSDRDYKFAANVLVVETTPGKKPVVETSSTAETTDLYGRIEFWFYDENQRKIPDADWPSREIRGTDFWKPDEQLELVLEGVTDQRIRFVEIRLTLYSVGPAEGEAYFDALRFQVFPRIDIIPKHKPRPGDISTADMTRINVFRRETREYEDKPDFTFICRGFRQNETHTHRLTLRDLFVDDLQDAAPIAVIEKVKTVELADIKYFEMVFDENPMADVDSGCYSLLYQVFSGNDIVAEKELHFSRLGDLGLDKSYAMVTLAPGRLGIFTQPLGKLYAEKMEILLRAKPGVVKMPLWYNTFSLKDREAGAADARKLSIFMVTLRRANVELVAVFDLANIPVELLKLLAFPLHSPPTGMRDILARSKADWAPYVRETLKDHTDFHYIYQMGGDADPSFGANAVIDAVSGEFNNVVTGVASWVRTGVSVNILELPKKDTILAPIAGTEPLDIAALAQPGVTVVSVFVPNDFSAEKLFEFWDNLAETSGEIDVIATIQPDDSEVQRHTKSSVAKLAAKVLSGLGSQAVSKVFVGPFADAGTEDTSVAISSGKDGLIQESLQPKPAYVMFRTISELVGDATPLESITLAPGVRGYPFLKGKEEVIMAVWTDGEPLTFPTYLGKNVRKVDLMGRTVEILPSEEIYDMVVDSIPVFYIGLDKNLVDFLQSFHIDNDVLASAEGRQRRIFTVTNTFDEPINGEITLSHPAKGILRWGILPNTLEFAKIQPGESISWGIDITLNINQPEGLEPLVAHMQITRNRITESGEMKTLKTSARAIRNLEVKSEIELEMDFLKQEATKTKGIRARPRVRNNSSTPISFTVTFTIPGTTHSKRRTVDYLAPGALVDIEPFLLPPVFEGKTMKMYLRESTAQRRFANGEFKITTKEE